VDDNRLEFAKTVGATHSINSAKEDAIQRVLELTDGRGADCAIEAVGLEATWNICQHVVKEGGHIANVGVHRSEEHTSELQSRENLVCRLLLENNNSHEV